MVKGTRKGMARKGAVRGARLAYDAVPASKKRKVGVKSAVRKAKARGASARGGVRVAKKVHSMFS
tara:strand:- start:628 stop:822 length:195 start_codon:yes stop_codon:yes gene_type:complete